jgi:anti-sigma B factor antagonist
VAAFLLGVQRRAPPSCCEWAVAVVSQERHPVLWIGQTAVVMLPAEVDLVSADQVREDLLSVLNLGADLLIADLSQTTFCDSAGIGALVRTFRRADASHSEMRLVVTTAAVRRVLSLTGIDRMIDIYPNVTAALAGPHDSAVQNDATPGENATAKADTGGGAA